MLNVAILGFGVVGSGVYEVINMNKEKLSDRIGEPISVKKILDLRTFPGTPYESIVTSDMNEILSDPEISVVVECMGGSHPAYDYSMASLKAGKSVVTSNKEVVANFGSELLAEARKNGVKYLFEASVGGGIPLIHPLCECLSINNVEQIAGILNGTTNYILTRMLNEGLPFDEVLAEAQRLGYAEKNPTADVDGIDAARKICILSDIAYGKEVSVSEIRAEGIRNITSRDVEDAHKIGCKIKLLGYSRPDGDGIYCLVAPFFVPVENIISQADDVFNCVLVTGNAVGDVAFYGRGAGKLPTAAAIVSDITEAVLSSSCKLLWTKNNNKDYVRDPETLPGRLYVRFASDNASFITDTVSCEASVISEKDGKVSVVTGITTEKELKKSLCILEEKGIKAESLIRLL
ncbi:MAG: homoserine dehydrogenase [Ruminococcaceae bacterium]|nr:homoserine dehydrogenase [Oscillospiraceae bacterium]